MDSKLNWSKHIIQLSDRLRKLIYVFRELRYVLSRKTIKMTYMALCQSLMIYGIVGWGACTKQALDPLIKTQKLLLRIINRKPNDYQSERLFKESKVLDVKQLFIKYLLIFFHKHKDKHDQSQQNCNTRRSQKQNFLIPRVQTTFAQRQPFFLGPRLYNDIEEKWKHLKNIQEFKHNINKWLFELGRSESENLVCKSYV